ncbi:MAG: prevent-host-death protein [Verrucomicrobia bacterium]|jgi:antitoxin (DNA-binding transcriptional repressor) of toxin-antitoxin stability system|nr:prevent-host-death protein [Verrucomicrobiota bacterium]
MKTASVRDLRNSFARISRWLEAGEIVEITKRGRVFAHVLPAMATRKKKTPKPDIMTRLRADFGDTLVSDEIYEELIRTDRMTHVERLS